MEKLLVIDDEARICEILRKFLTKKGYDVSTATSVLAGIEKVKNEKPKVVFLDIRMPGMTGVEAIKRIKEINPKIGIIMATAVVDEKVAQETIRMGASDYIIKPFDLDYLEKTLLVKLAEMRFDEPY